MQHTLTHTVHIQIFLLKEPSFDGFLKKKFGKYIVHKIKNTVNTRC